jgi:3-phenylpropionate/cinnamic acid dioxygenase small subunit
LTPADFLYHETALLDERRFEEWLELFTEDALYWIPQGDEADPSRHVSLVYDDRRRLHERVLRLASGFAYSQDPPSKTCHLVGNVQVVDGADGDVEVSSTLLVAEVRRNAQNLFAGRVAHTLLPEGASFRIRRKTVRLVNSDVPLGNVTFLF